MSELSYGYFKEEMTDDLIALWNKDVYGSEIYAEFDKDDFTNRFLNCKYFDLKGTVAVTEGERVIGFGSACYRPGNDQGFITCIVVAKEYRRRGIGSEILRRLEDYLRRNGCLFIRNYFASPINLKWYVPGYDRHEHPGAPAVPYNGSYYFFLSANGYCVNGQQDAYHLDLTEFVIDEAIERKIRENEKEGYTIAFYDPKLHYGFDAMFDALHNEGFRKSVHDVLASPDPDPLLICQRNGEILGFTGPIRTEPSGRAFLTGLAIHPKVWRRGLGKTLFCKFCEKSKENGAKFMTLFTGSDNNARKIYLYAGMRVVMSFAIMRKELL